MNCIGSVCLQSKNREAHRPSLLPRVPATYQAEVPGSQLLPQAQAVLVLGELLLAAWQAHLRQSQPGHATAQLLQLPAWSALPCAWLPQPARRLRTLALRALSFGLQRARLRQCLGGAQSSC